MIPSPPPPPRYARHDPSLPMKAGGIGWLGDQTLYSWMSVNGTGAGRDASGGGVFHHMPCG